MNRLCRPAVAIVILVIFYWLRHRHDWPDGMIVYRDQQFKMSKSYANYEDYKDDPDNLDTNELSRIEKAITNAQMPATFVTRKDFIQALFNLKFPGYGLETNGSKEKTDDGSTLELDSVEIPQTDKNRFLVTRTSSSPLVLLDDFVSTNVIDQVELKEGKISYRDAKGRLVREQQVIVK